MWLPDRRTVLLLPLLAGCGFSPAYGPQGVAENLQGAVRVATPADKNAFDLVERLEERLGRPAAVRYELAYAVATKAVGVGLTPEATITRYNLTGSVDWALAERSSGARVAGGREETFTSYSATGSTVAGLAAEEDAATRLMRILADRIVTRLLAARL
jgi:LPS-assembly lipoprotein